MTRALPCASWLHQAAYVICGVCVCVQKRYLAVGPDAVLTSSRKDKSASRLYPSLPPSPRKHPHGAASPRKTPRKTPTATPRAPLPSVPDALPVPAGSPAAVPSKYHVSTAAPETVTIPASDAPSMQAASTTAAATAALSEAVVKKKHVAIAPDLSVRPASTSGELDGGAGVLPTAAEAGTTNSQQIAGSGAALSLSSASPHSQYGNSASTGPIFSQSHSQSVASPTN